MKYQFTIFGVILGFIVSTILYLLQLEDKEPFQCNCSRESGLPKGV